MLRLPGGLRLRVDRPIPPARRGCGGRSLPAVRPAAYLAEHGRPIRYRHVDGEWPLASLQNVYADRPGSAEMPSAGRPLTEALLTRLMAAGVPVVPVVLDAGVSSQEVHEPPQPERFTVPAVTARLVNSTLHAGRRVVAVGTTVVRALESARAGGVWSRRRAGRRWSSDPPARRGWSVGCSPGCTSPTPATWGCWRRWRASPRRPGVHRGDRGDGSVVPLARVRRLDAPASLTRVARDPGRPAPRSWVYAARRRASTVAP